MTPGQRAEAEADIAAVYAMNRALAQVDPTLMARLAKGLRLALERIDQLEARLGEGRSPWHP